MKLFNIVLRKTEIKIGDDLREKMKHDIEASDFLQLGKNEKQYNQDTFLHGVFDSLKTVERWTQEGDRENYCKHALVLTTDKYKVKGLIKF